MSHNNKTEEARAGSLRAPGKPGKLAHWSSSRKSAAGTSRSQISHVWFTASHGILTEIYYPRIDQAAVKDVGLIVTDGAQFFSEEKTDTASTAAWLAGGVPAFHFSNRCLRGRYRIEKHLIADPQRHVVLQRTRFEALVGSNAEYRLHVILAPRLGNQGSRNNASVGEFKGIPMLFAAVPGHALALACSVPWKHRSVGYVGISDGWQDLRAHGRMQWEYASACEGNVALTAEIDTSADPEFLLAIAFGRTQEEAAHRARISLSEGFERAAQSYVRQWRGWQKRLHSLGTTEPRRAAYRISTAVLATHESKDFPGGTIASLSSPWGEIQDDSDRGGYHLVWPRDSYEAASALIAAGAQEEAVRTLNYFAASQEADGHWPQNMWLGGRGFWSGIQLDESAAPILLLDLARRHGRIDGVELHRLWPMVRNAAAFIAREGPATPQDRWEEDAGLTPFTLASTIAALLIAAECAEREGEPLLAAYLCETADAWNDSIEDWLYVENTALARSAGVEGYYVRLAPVQRLYDRKPLTQQRIQIPNHEQGLELPAAAIVSADALALVRFGLRPANDPRVLNTLRVIDSVLKVDTPRGPCWYRYNHDGYGEKADGAPFDGAGIGRAWPLLVGERAHYEIAAGNLHGAEQLLDVLQRQTGDTGFFPEQIWDEADIPDRELFCGQPSGSAQPLVWAHAEHVKLIRSIEDGVVFDLPPQTVARYLTARRRAVFAPWRFEAPVTEIHERRRLRIETRSRACIRFSLDEWRTFEDIETRDTGIGIFVADLPTAELPAGKRVIFTFFWPDAGTWEKRNREVKIED